MRGSPSWLLMVTGTLLVFCIRPHVALVVAGSIAVAGWLGTWRRITLRRLLEIGAAAVVAAVAFQGMLAQFGFGAADLEGMREFAEFNAQQTLQGGSNIGASPLTGAGLPLAFVNVWLRPFLWEAHNVMAALSALEIAIFWVIVWRYRKVAKASIRQWRTSRLLLFAVPFIVAYTLMIGMTFGNMGILARQRTPLFVFAFMPLAGVAATAPVRRRLRLRWAHTSPVRHHVREAAPR